MTEEHFQMLKAWIRAEAKLITSEMIGHHPRTVATRMTKAFEAERAARVVLQVAD